MTNNYIKCDVCSFLTKARDSGSELESIKISPGCVITPTKGVLLISNLLLLAHQTAAPQISVTSITFRWVSANKTIKCLLQNSKNENFDSKSDRQHNKSIL